MDAQRIQQIEETLPRVASCAHPDCLQVCTWVPGRRGAARLFCSPRCRADYSYKRAHYADLIAQLRGIRDRLTQRGEQLRSASPDGHLLSASQGAAATVDRSVERETRAESRRVAAAERQARWLLERFPQHPATAAEAASRPPRADEPTKPATDGLRQGEAMPDSVHPTIAGPPRQWSASELRAELSRWEAELRERGRSAATVAMYSRRVGAFLSWVATQW